MCRSAINYQILSKLRVSRSCAAVAAVSQKESTVTSEVPISYNRPCIVSDRPQVLFKGCLAA